MGPVNLIPEEAYDWNYAQNLDWSYLDHPPMVAWLIWISTALFGRSEFAVVLPALIPGISAAGLSSLDRQLFYLNAAFRRLLRWPLPLYFGFGFFITPDAPLFAAWAGCLFYLYRALIAESRGSWFGVALCMGVGLLSKYTILLLAFTTAGFLLVDRRSRQWWFRVENYLAALFPEPFFLPVLIWNAEWDGPRLSFKALVAGRTILIFH